MDPMLSWSEIDTVLLDMDGTLIDLHFDNALWNLHLPTRIAEAQAIDIDDARDHLYGHMRGAAPSLDFSSIGPLPVSTSSPSECSHYSIYEPSQVQRYSFEEHHWEPPIAVRVCRRSHKLACTAHGYQ